MLCHVPYSPTALAPHSIPCRQPPKHALRIAFRSGISPPSIHLPRPCRALHFRRSTQHTVKCMASDTDPLARLLLKSNDALPYAVALTTALALCVLSYPTHLAPAPTVRAHPLSTFSRRPTFPLHSATSCLPWASTCARKPFSTSFATRRTSSSAASANGSSSPSWAFALRSSLSRCCSCHQRWAPAWSWYVGLFFLLLISCVFLSTPHNHGSQTACVSGAQLSSYATFLAHPEQAPLAIVLTALSTAAGVVVTPALVQVLLGARVPVDAVAMSRSIFQIVILPIAAGMLGPSNTLHVERHHAS